MLFDIPMSVMTNNMILQATMQCSHTMVISTLNSLFSKTIFQHRYLSSRIDNRVLVFCFYYDQELPHKVYQEPKCFDRNYLALKQ